jgi:hypothetical protein
MILSVCSSINNFLRGDAVNLRGYIKYLPRHINAIVRIVFGEATGTMNLERKG